MTSFTDSIKQGFDAAKRAQRNREEIREVIAAASADLASVTDGQLTLELEKIATGPSLWVASAAATILGSTPLPKDRKRVLSTVSTL